MQVSTWCKIFDPLVIIGLLVDAMMQRECANFKLYYELAVIKYCDEQRTRADEPQATSSKKSCCLPKMHAVREYYCWYE